MVGPPRSRILIVDDSGVMRSMLRSVIAGDASLEVAGTACDGVSALRAVESLKPDVILLDVDMPVMDGLHTLRALRKGGCLTPIIMCSALTQRGARVTIEALADGATDYVAKPSGQSDREAAVQLLRGELLPKIPALLRRRMEAPVRLPLGAFASAVTRPPAAPEVVAIGVSTGGPAALDKLLSVLPASFPLPILIVQHMPETFTSLLANRLDESCALHVVEATEGMEVRPGTCVIARGNWHMEVAGAAADALPRRLRLHQAEAEHHCRPSVDVLLRSVARVYGPAGLGVILTGMGSDGLLGCRALRQCGGMVLAQDEASSAVWGMPGAVAGAQLAHRVLPLNQIAGEILRVTSRDLYETRERAL